MVRVCRGDLFDSQADAWVNPVNCEGVSGKGLALAFRHRFPEHYDAYRAQCLSDIGFHVGDAFVTETDLDLPRFIVAVPTKDRWRHPSRLLWVVAAARSLCAVSQRFGFRSMAVPALGCGLGGLDWGMVQPLLVATFDGEVPDLQVDLYEPG